MDTLKIEIGTPVRYKNKDYKITHLLGLTRVLLRCVTSGEFVRADISQLIHISDEAKKKNNQPIDVSTYTEKEWKVAEKRYEIIKPLLDGSIERTKETVQVQAKRNGVSLASIYRWLASYDKTGRLSSLTNQRRSDKGKSRLGKDVDQLINEVIEEYYLTSNKRKVSQAYQKLKILAKKGNIRIPSEMTFTRRINEISNAEKTEKRISYAERRAKYSPVLSGYKEATFPLSVVQIDHTPVDLMFVDEDERKSIGRAWLTVAICVFSRIVCGYYLSYEKPSVASVGLCLVNSILPKEQFLSDLQVDSNWPIWGVMDNLHADNAKEFRSIALDRVTTEYGINMNWRPVGKADYGGHIERLLGTFNKDIHELEGTTFSNIKERGRYKSEERAIFTLNEFDKWLAVYITKVYHKSGHTGLNGMTPLAKLEEGFLGTDDEMGHGLPERVVDKERLRLDFLPIFERSVQRYGIEIDGIAYYHPALAKWIKQKNPNSLDHKGKFTVKRDPRDISKVYFLDPELNDYIEIPCRNRSAPCITVWELKEIQKRLREKGKSTVNEEDIFRAREELMEIEQMSKEKTKKQRRMKERTRTAKRAIKKEKMNDEIRASSDVDVFSVEIDAFDDIEV